MSLAPTTSPRFSFIGEGRCVDYQDEFYSGVEKEYDSDCWVVDQNVLHRLCGEECLVAFESTPGFVGYDQGVLEQYRAREISCTCQCFFDTIESIPASLPDGFAIVDAFPRIYRGVGPIKRAVIGSSSTGEYFRQGFGCFAFNVRFAVDVLSTAEWSPLFRFVANLF
jgi:hypothetical protein|eukprot:scaffold4255_cov124-Alexandrium_tamarense.AAC.3